MIMKTFSVYDGAVKAWNQPMFFRAREEAVRSFQSACAENEQFKRHAHDYTFWYLGEFDDGTGRFTNFGNAPERVCGASDFVVDNVLPPTKHFDLRQANGRLPEFPD